MLGSCTTPSPQPIPIHPESTTREFRNQALLSPQASLRGFGPGDPFRSNCPTVSFASQSPEACRGLEKATLHAMGEASRMTQSRGLGFPEGSRAVSWSSQESDVEI